MTDAAAGSALTLYTLLANKAGTRGLRSGRLISPLIEFDYDDVDVVNRRFKALMRDAQYDFAEVALITSSIEQLVAYGRQQDLISRRFTADELYADTMRILGPAAA